MGLGRSQYTRSTHENQLTVFLPSRNEYVNTKIKNTIPFIIVKKKKEKEKLGANLIQYVTGLKWKLWNADERNQGKSK